MKLYTSMTGRKYEWVYVSLVQPLSLDMFERFKKLILEHTDTHTQTYTFTSGPCSLIWAAKLWVGLDSFPDRFFDPVYCAFSISNNWFYLVGFDCSNINMYTALLLKDCCDRYFLPLQAIIFLIIYQDRWFPGTVQRSFSIT